MKTNTRDVQLIIIMILITDIIKYVQYITEILD